LISRFSPAYAGLPGGWGDRLAGGDANRRAGFLSPNSPDHYALLFPKRMSIERGLQLLDNEQLVQQGLREAKTLGDVEVLGPMDTHYPDPDSVFVDRIPAP
jgi:hypothetical protein